MTKLKAAIHQRLSTFQALRNRDFALLWTGLATSGIGEQFSIIIALPWLVLQLTGDPLVVGTVMAAGPALAGLTIAVLTGREVTGQTVAQAPDTYGIGVAFSVNAAAYGLVMSALGVGMIGGTVVAGVTRPPRQVYFGPILMTVITIAGVCTILLSFVETTRIGAACTAVMGLGFGYIDVVIFTWLQRRVPEELVGRTMGLVMFVIVGMHPLSNAVSGVVLSIDQVALFVGAGGAMCAAMAVYAMIPSVRSLGASAPDDDPSAAG